MSEGNNDFGDDSNIPQANEVAGEEKHPSLTKDQIEGIVRRPRGRPIKQVRALMPSQTRRDIIQAGEAPTRVRTPSGTKVVSVYEAIIMRLVQKALSGHGPSMRRFLDLYNQAIADHYTTHKKMLSFITLVEKLYIERTEDPESEKKSVQFLNRLKAGKRRF